MNFETAFISAIEKNDIIAFSTIGVNKVNVNEMFSSFLNIPQKKGQFRLSSVAHPTPLIYAICCRQFQAVVTLLNLGASLTQDLNGWQPIHYAVLSQDKSIAAFLLANNKNLVNAQTPTKATPLHFAVSASDLQMVLFLLSNGADPNLANELKQTPLHLAIASTDIKIVIALLVFSAKLNAKDKDGHTPEDIAKLRNNNACIHYFEGINSGKIKIPSKEEVLSDYIQEEPPLDVNPFVQEKLKPNEVIDKIEKRIDEIEKQVK